MKENVDTRRSVDVLRNTFYRDEEHPYRLFEREVARRLTPEGTLMDAGCGRMAPVLSRFVGKARTLIGVDMADDFAPIAGITWVRRDLADTALSDRHVDIVMSRSVMEHVNDPLAVYREIWRVLKPGGYFVILTPNLFDYSALIARIVPNRFHPWIVSRAEGRAEHDVFPVKFRANTRRAVYRLARASGFSVSSFRYLGQYPAYLMFNPALFVLGTAYDKFISRFEPLGWLRGWILTVLHKPEEQGEGSPAGQRSGISG